MRDWSRSPSHLKRTMAEALEKDRRANVRLPDIEGALQSKR
jgi:hypothetical protein